jgi:hypothetical protein
MMACEQRVRGDGELDGEAEAVGKGGYDRVSGCPRVRRRRYSSPSCTLVVQLGIAGLLGVGSVDTWDPSSSHRPIRDRHAVDEERVDSLGKVDSERSLEEGNGEGVKRCGRRPCSELALPWRAVG